MVRSTVFLHFANDPGSGGCRCRLESCWGWRVVVGEKLGPGGVFVVSRRCRTIESMVKKVYLPAMAHWR